MIIDSHCHLNYEPMYSSLKTVIARAKAKNVDYLLTISTVDKDYEKLLSIIKNNNEVYGTYGIHPHEAKNHKEINSRLIVEKTKMNKKIIGIKIAPLNDEIKRERLGPATALFYAIKETWFVIDASWNFIVSMFKGTGDTSQLGGPIKIAKITGQVAKFGVVAFLSIMAYISISLGL